MREKYKLTMPKFEVPSGDSGQESSTEKILFQTKLEGLLSSDISLTELVQILGAEKYLTEEGPRGKEGLHFNVKAFVEDQFKEGTVPILLPEKQIKLKETILPPGKAEIVTGSGEGFDENGTIPRVNTFVQILSRRQEPYLLVLGTNSPNMMRGESYHIFLVPNQEKLVFINDEEGNATFVVHKASEGEWRRYAAMKKEELKELQGEGIQVINYPGSLEEWSAKVEEALYSAFSVKEKQESGLELAPEGWMTKNALSKELGISDKLIVKKIAPFRETNSEWFQQYSDKIDRVFEYYHPDLIAEMKKDMAKRPQEAPEGWLTNNALRMELDLPFPLIQKIAQSYKISHPDWFKEHLVKGGQVLEHYHPDLIAEVKKQIASRSEHAPEGWKTNSGLADQLNVSFQMISTIANRSREEHPEWFQEFLNIQGHTYEHYHPDLVASIIKEVISRSEHAPEGWLTNTALSKELAIDVSVISKSANIFRETNPEWFGVFLDKVNHSREHYHPDLLNKIREEIKSRPDVAPEGWMTKNALLDETGGGVTFVTKRVNQFLETHPQWFKDFRMDNGQIGQHYHPDLVAKIKEELASRPESAPEGWLTNYNLALECGVAFKTVSTRAGIYREEHPEWFQYYLDKVNRTTEYYHPELIARIKKDFASTETISKAPEGWMTTTSTAGFLNVDRETIASRAELFREEHPEWFRIYLNSQGRRFEHYHPELIAKVKAEIEARPELAPEGWKTTRGLAMELGVAAKFITRRAELYREEHPEWFQSYTEKMGRALEHYHPEFVKIIKEEVEKRPELAPDGWMTNTGIANSLSRGQKTITKLATLLADGHREWIHPYQDNIGHVYDYYHPDLVKAIEIKLENNPDFSPEGWMTNHALSRELDISPETVAVRAGLFRETHPEWFQIYLNAIGNKSEHYHPDLIQAIKDKINERPSQAPEGWMTNKSLSREVGLMHGTLKRMADPYRESNPEWFQIFLGGVERELEFYHPDLIQAIKDKINERPSQAPEGWMTKKSISRNLNLGQFRLAKFTDSQRESHPEWFAQYLDVSGKSAEHLHPDLVAKIVEELGKN